MCYLDGNLEFFSGDPPVDLRIFVGKARDYPQVVMKAIKEMHRQVGDLVLNEHGIAERGLIVRHLIMPDGLAGTRKVVEFLARKISRNTYVNIMLV